MRYLRLQPYSIETEEGRTAERYRRALLATIASVLARAISWIGTILTVRMTLPYLGAEQFGAWMTIASFGAVLAFLDFGIGNALTNKVAVANGSDPQRLRVVISGGLGVLAVISLMFAAPLVAIASFLPWHSLFKLQSSVLAEEVRITAMLFGGLYAASIFTNSVGRVMGGLQRGFEANLAMAFGGLVGLIALFFAARAKAGLPVLLLCSMLSVQLANLMLLGRLWREGYFNVENWVLNMRSERSGLITSGGLFLFLQIAAMVGWGADSFIIASTTGAASVAAFAVVQRLTQLISQPLGMINAPLWGAYADAAARREHAFIKSTFKKSIGITFFASLCGAICLIIFGQQVIAVWTIGELKPSTSLLIVMAIWLVFESSGNALGILLNALDIVKQQVFVVGVFVAIAIPLKISLASNFGAVGLVTAGILAYAVTTIIGYGIIFRKDILGKMT